MFGRKQRYMQPLEFLSLCSGLGIMPVEYEDFYDLHHDALPELPLPPGILIQAHAINIHRDAAIFTAQQEADWEEIDKGGDPFAKYRSITDS